MSIIMEKLTSRKLWAAIAGVVSGLAMVFGLDEGIISTVAGAVTSVVSIVAYIHTEGKIDAAALAVGVVDVAEAIEIITGEDTTEEGSAE